MAKISLESFAAERKANLMLLYEYARKFEETTFKGLYGFLNYLSDVQAGKNDFDRAKVISENSGAVKIMSVHKSKGLEFPVCILTDTGRQFNRKDYAGNPVITDEGVYFDLKYTDEIGIEKTPFKKIFGEKIKNDMLSEEARILYVALTRAVDKLIITGSADNIGRFLSRDAGSPENSDSVLKWLAPVLLNPDGGNKTNIDFDIDLVDANKLREMITGIGQKLDPAVITDEKINRAGAGRPRSAEIAGASEKIRRMYDFEYKRDFLSKIPAKVLVTKMRPGLVTEDEYAAAALRELEMSTLPRFLEEETKENIPALAGTAAHLFMQFADFEYAEIFGAQNEAENLLSRRFITEAHYSRLKFYPIDRFFASDLYAQIKAAKKVYRETPFNLKVPASEFTGNGGFLNTQTQNKNKNKKETDQDYVLIQGAIDLFFETHDGRLYVVDFKTDQVSGPDGEKILAERHKTQIEYYCKAAGEISNRKADGAYIYSFALNKAIHV
jgi:ATP-dependent helicase/nuclease subunit A